VADGKPHRNEPSARARIEGRIGRILGGLPGSWLLRMIREPPLVRDGQTLDPHVQFILAMQRRKPPQLLCEPTPSEGRQRNRNEIAASSTAAGARPTRVHFVRDIAVNGAVGTLTARHYAPPHAGSDVAAPLLVFFHGGGFVICDLDTHDEPCRMLCQHGNMHVLSVAYRLAPEHPFPAPLDDCTAALQWAQTHAGELGADPHRVCVGGDSAGANLATVVALAAAQRRRPVAAQLLIYPTADASRAHPSLQLFSDGFVLTAADMHAFTQHYIANDTALRNDPRVSPALSPDLSHAPPALVITAGFDPLRDEGEAYAAALAAAGVTVQLHRERGLVHGFLHMTTVVPAAYAAVRGMGVAFRKLVDVKSRA
jgi:acetyl esterase